MGKPKKIAIACQGGGSQTAFTAGVLQSFFKYGVQEKYEIVSLSGTSGGAVCATLAWYGMLKAAAGDPTPIASRLEAFWHANSAQTVLETLLNDSLVKFNQLVGEGWLPEWKIGPNTPLLQVASAASKAGFPRFFDFQQLLETHIDFKEIPALVKPSSPVLLIGAANVLTGEFKKFSSLQDEIQVKSILASAAVPTLFPAVEIEDQFYWDGLFSDNPPTDELIQTDFVGKDRKPDELWVIQINPKTVKEVPITPEEILDRRNEMIGNESLFQDLEQIALVNRFLERGAFKKAYVKEHDLKKIDIFTIQMSEELLDNLDFASKLDRNAAFINRLLEDGESQGDLFLKNQNMMRY